MCYEPGYAHLSKTEQREERARIQAHHVELRANLNAGLPGAQEAYDAHLEHHRKAKWGGDHSFAKADERARSILMQREAEERVRSRKAQRRLQIEEQMDAAAGSRDARILRRAARRRDAALIFGGTVCQIAPERELVPA